MQTNFFDIIKPEAGTHRIPVKIYRYGEGVYLAVIEDGWWTAYGRTPQDAVNKVAIRFTRETETERLT